jgi:hypothetical protein
VIDIKKYKLWLLCVIIALIAVYIVMLCDTDSVLQDFRDCVSGEVSENLKDSALYELYYNANAESAEVKVRRNFVIHNFTKGVIYANYTYHVFDKDGNEVRGSHKVPTKWYIEKINGRWSVVDIDERP